MPSRAAISRMMPPPMPPPTLPPRPMPRRSWTCEGSSWTLSLKLMLSQYRVPAFGRLPAGKVGLMPFLDRLQRWADDRPDGTAVVVAGQRLSWEELRDTAAGLVPGTPAVTVLSEENSLHFAAAFAAAVAGERQCAVLDPTWPQQLQDRIRDRIRGTVVPAAGGRASATDLADGPPDTPFLIGLTSGTTSVPKAFSRSRRSWQLSFDASVEFFGLHADDKTLAPGPLAASLNLYALAECLYAGSEFHTLARFDVGDAHAAVSHDGITRLVLVPTMLRLLSERGLSGGVDASGIRSIICAGSKLDARTLEAARRWAPNATIFEYYGASELSFVSGAGLPPGQQPEQRGTGIGQAVSRRRDPHPRRRRGPSCRTALTATSASAAAWSATATSGATTARPCRASTAGTPWGTRATSTAGPCTCWAAART